MSAGRAEGAAPLGDPGLLAAIVEGTPDAVFVKDLEGRYLMVNSACARILGRPREEIVGRSDAQILPPETAKRLAEDDRLVLDTGEASSYEEVLPVDGQPRTYLSTKSVYRDAAGNALGIIGISRDITERKEAERELTRSEERLRSSRDQLDAVLRGVADGVTAQDPTGRLIYANEAAAGLVGYPSAREFLEAPLSDVMARFEVFDGEGRPFPLGNLPGRRALSGEEGAEEVLRFRVKATGEERWSVVRAEPVFDERGEVRVVVNVFRDVTEARRAEEERARLAAIVRSSEDAIFGKTLEGTITSWNPGAEKVYGYSAEEAVGRHVSVLAPPELADEVPAILERVGRGEVVSLETARLTKGGRTIDVSLTVSPIKDPGDKVVGASTIARDITERKRAEAAEFEVREAERTRLARDLHDGVLQDLSVVVQRLEVRRVASEVEGPDSGLGREIDALRRAVRGLREAVYDLRPGDEKPFLRRVEELAAHYRELTPEREVDLVVGEGFPSELPAGASNQLLRLVREALTNARQHSAARAVRVTLGASEDRLEVEVADDGRGFAAGATDGGMGLSTMRERAALLGGELEVSSEPGEGTRVRLRLARPDTP